MFQDESAWFSTSVDNNTKQLWKDHGGLEADFDSSQFIFSADSTAADTQGVFNTTAYENDHLAVFHSHYITDCVQAGERGKVVLGHYFLPPQDILNLVRKQMRLCWDIPPPRLPARPTERKGRRNIIIKPAPRRPHNADHTIAAWGHGTAPPSHTQGTTGDRLATRGTTGDRPATQGTTGDRPATQGTTGDRLATQGTTGDRLATQGTTGDRPATQGTTGDRLATQGTTCDRPATQGATGERPASQGTTGDRLATQGTTGDRLATQGTTGDRLATQGTTGDRPATQGTTGDRLDTQGTTCDRLDSQGTTGDRLVTQGTTGDRPATQGTTGDRPATQGTTGDRLATQSTAEGISMTVGWRTDPTGPQASQARHGRPLPQSTLARGGVGQSETREVRRQAMTSEPPTSQPRPAVTATRGSRASAASTAQQHTQSTCSTGRWSTQQQGSGCVSVRQQQEPSQVKVGGGSVSTERSRQWATLPPHSHGSGGSVSDLPSHSRKRNVPGLPEVLSPSKRRKQSVMPATSSARLSDSGATNTRQQSDSGATNTGQQSDSGATNTGQQSDSGATNTGQQSDSYTIRTGAAAPDARREAGISCSTEERHGLTADNRVGPVGGAQTATDTVGRCVVMAADVHGPASENATCDGRQPHTGYRASSKRDMDCAGMVVADIRQLKKVEASDLNDFIPNIDGAQVFLKHGPST